MFNKQNGLILAGIILGTLVLFCIFVSFHTSFHTCVSNAADSYRAEHQKAGTQAVPSVPIFNGYSTCAAKITRRDGDAITALATALLAIITLALVFLGLEQSKTTRAQLRAYVFADPEGVPEWSITDRLFIDVKFVNAGTTPAHDAEIYGGVSVFEADIEVAEVKIDKAAPKNTVPHPKVVLHPGKGLYSPFTTPTPLSHGDIEGIIGGTKIIYVYGMVIYRDVFDVRHETEFCQYMVPDAAKELLTRARDGAKVKGKMGFGHTHRFNRYT